MWIGHTLIMINESTKIFEMMICLGQKRIENPRRLDLFSHHSITPLVSDVHDVS